MHHPGRVKNFFLIVHTVWATCGLLISVIMDDGDREASWTKIVQMGQSATIIHTRQSPFCLLENSDGTYDYIWDWLVNEEGKKSGLKLRFHVPPSLSILLKYVVLFDGKLKPHRAKKPSKEIQEETLSLDSEDQSTYTFKAIQKTVVQIPNLNHWSACLDI